MKKYDLICLLFQLKGVGGGRTSCRKEKNQRVRGEFSLQLDIFPLLSNALFYSEQFRQSPWHCKCQLSGQRWEDCAQRLAEAEVSGLRFCSELKISCICWVQNSCSSSCQNCLLEPTWVASRGWRRLFRESQWGAAIYWNHSMPPMPCYMAVSGCRLGI